MWATMSYKNVFKNEAVPNPIEVSFIIWSLDRIAASA
jgi:hypothetical protein